MVTREQEIPLDKQNFPTMPFFVSHYVSCKVNESAFIFWFFDSSPYKRRGVKTRISCSFIVTSIISVLSKIAVAGLEVTLGNSQQADLLSFVSYPFLCTDLPFKLPIEQELPHCQCRVQSWWVRGRPPGRDSSIGFKWDKLFSSEVLTSNRILFFAKENVLSSESRYNEWVFLSSSGWPHQSVFLYAHIVR